MQKNRITVSTFPPLVKATRLHHAGDDHDIAFVFLVEPARLHHAGNDLAAVFIFLIAESRSRQPCRR